MREKNTTVCGVFGYFQRKLAGKIEEAVGWAGRDKDGDPGVNPNAFVNIDTYPIDNQNAAVERAKNECTIEYNATSEYYDSNADMWRIDFLTITHNEDGTLATSGECQSVYMNSDGITQLIVYGE